MTDDGLHKTPVPATGGDARRADRTSPSAKLVTSPLLRTDGGASQADRDKLLYAVDDRIAVLVELNLTHGISVSRKNFLDLFTATFTGPGVIAPVPIARQYLRCLLTQEQIKQLGDANRVGPDSIFRIWPDFRLTPHIDRSASTVKADAAARSYGTSGDGIVWAIIDSGIDESHPHFSGPDIGLNLTDERVAALRLHRCSNSTAHRATIRSRHCRTRSDMARTLLGSSPVRCRPRQPSSRLPRTSRRATTCRFGSSASSTWVTRSPPRSPARWSPSPPR